MDAPDVRGEQNGLFLSPMAEKQGAVCSMAPFAHQRSLKAVSKAAAATFGLFLSQSEQKDFYNQQIIKYLTRTIFFRAERRRRRNDSGANWRQKGRGRGSCRERGFRPIRAEMSKRRQRGGAYVVVMTRIQVVKSAEANLSLQRTQLTVSHLLKVIPLVFRGITLHKRLIY